MDPNVYLVIAALVVIAGLVGTMVPVLPGAVVGELWARRDFSQAGKVGLGTWIGLLTAALAKVVLAFLMIATFLAFYLVTM